jgi:hypothetical protein
MAAVTKYADAYYGVMPDDRLAGIPACRTGDYKADAAYDANSKVYMCKIPSGARILRIDYKTSALGAARVLDIGNATVEAKYGEAIDVSSAVSGSIIPANAVLAADEAIVFKIEGDTLPEDGELMAHVWYKMADCIEDEAAVAS